MSKRVLCLDFDGVIHLYSKGWQDGSIYDGVTPGFFRWLSSAVGHFDVTIYSSRSKTEGGRASMAGWLDASYSNFLETLPADHGFDKNLLDFVRFPHEKPPAFITIDDRALTFTGNWGDFDPEKLIEFKPWNVKKPALQALAEVTTQACSPGNWDYDEYLRGMANGLILASAIMRGTEPEYLHAPERKNTEANPKMARRALLLNR